MKLDDPITTVYLILVVVTLAVLVPGMLRWL